VGGVALVLAGLPPVPDLPEPVVHADHHHGDLLRSGRRDAATA
jgi:hypothetical protein